jgi:hypothetical protein
MFFLHLRVICSTKVPFTSQARENKVPITSRQRSDWRWDFLLPLV